MTTPSPPQPTPTETLNALIPGIHQFAQFIADEIVALKGDGRYP